MKTSIRNMMMFEEAETLPIKEEIEDYRFAIFTYSDTLCWVYTKMTDDPEKDAKWFLHEWDDILFQDGMEVPSEEWSYKVEETEMFILVTGSPYRGEEFTLFFYK